MDNRKIVVIGGVAAGATAAAKARRTSEDADISLLEKGKYISFANCGLPYYTGGTIESRNKILLHTPKSYGGRFNVDVNVNTEAVDIDRKAKKVLLSSKEGEGEIEYDRLIIAVGGKMIIPPIEGIDNTPYFTMRTVEDADSVKEFIEKSKPKSAVIIGGGFIGVETAEAMLHCGLETTIVEAKPEIMPNLPQVVAMNLREYIENSGVSVKRGVFASKVEKDGGIKVSLSSGETIETDMLFLCTGVLPNTDLAEKAGLRIGETGGIWTDDTMRTSDPEIYAAGDAVEKLNRITRKKVLLPLAGPANREGRTAGYNSVTDGDVKFPGVIGTSIVGFGEYCAACTGLTYEKALEAGYDAEYVYTEDADISEYYPGFNFIFLKTVYEKKTGKILGAAASGKTGVDKRIDCIATAITGGLTVYDLEHLELAYAPQFAAAKDNLNLAGFAASNRLRGTGYIITPEEMLEILRKEKDTQLVDVRTKMEYRHGRIDDAVNIYVNELRKNLDKIDKSRPVYLYCAVGFRGYIALRTLRNLGYEAYNITGGIEAFNRIKKIL
ncbi:FAD-dependent oxidoreductase [Limisalsivibrio acetivorans]|uniref:FAD-dependent oxidoreductase n=1 Tax=Limisalsivibrio acetivorans TaxID=1304888 RepID=UPI0003B6653E|nr:FAD-dependent oxidoreductase [Limisalsivibrio acetivorans]